MNGAHSIIIWSGEIVTRFTKRNQCQKHKIKRVNRSKWQEEYEKEEEEGGEALKVMIWFGEVSTVGVVGGEMKH